MQGKFNGEKLRGVFAPIVTPFKDEEIEFGKLKENIERYNTTDLKGYMPLGSNGEYLGLSEEESLKVLETVQKYKAPEKITIVGCGRESAKAALEFIRKVAYYGADIASVLTPHYYADKMTDEALMRYFTGIADKSPLPVMIYNAPKFASGILISPEVAAILSEHPNIVSLKNSSSVHIAKYKEAIREDADFRLLAGNIKTFYPGLTEGAAGGVLSTACYLPEYCCKLYRLYLSSEKEEAVKLHNFLCGLSDNTVGRFGVAGVKFALDLLGYWGGEPRIPLLPIKPDDRRQIEEYFRNSGIVRNI